MISLDGLEELGGGLEAFFLLPMQRAVEDFADRLGQYARKFNVDPNVVIIRVPGWDKCNKIERTLKGKGIDVDVIEIDSVDQIAIPNLINLLSRKSIFDLVQEILALNLPKREDWDRAHLKEVV